MGVDLGCEFKVYSLLHHDPDNTMISTDKLRLFSWSIGLDFAANFVYDLIVNHTLEFCDGLEWEFGVNIFGFGRNFCVQIHLILCAQPRRGLNSPYLTGRLA